MTIRWRHLLWLLVAMAVGALTAGWSGIIGIGASSGHWTITNIVLHWGMEQSVETAALSVEAPADLDDPTLVRRAARHFETSCAFCHGSPARHGRSLPHSMTPPPPTLEGSAAKWTPEQLFVIVKHGVKFSGMPAWISLSRDDEVWAMVSFLRALPAMDEAAYNQLTAGDLARTAPDDPVLANCIGCHGYGGAGQNGAFPVIGGQRLAYLQATLDAFAQGRRASGIMQYAAASLSPEELDRAAEYYAGLLVLRQSGPDADPMMIERGRQIATQGLPASKVPACLSCHGRDRTANPAFPVLDGQAPWYLATQLRLWKDKVRGGTRYAHLMKKVVIGLTEQDILAAAAYFGSLDSPGRAQAADGMR